MNIKCPFCGKSDKHGAGETCLNDTTTFDLVEQAQEKAEPVAWQRRIKADQGNWLRWEYFSGADEYENDRSKFPDQVGRWQCEYRALDLASPAEHLKNFDRTIETPRRRQAVEKLLSLGWTYHHERGWAEPAPAEREHEKAEPVGHLQIGSSGGVHIHATEAARRLGEGNYRLYAASPAERVRVPDMPTREMYEATFEIKQYVAFDRFCRDWQQMLSAAPEASSHD